MDERRRVLVLHTGGTLGMRSSADGWVPAPGFLERQLAEHSVFRAEGMPEIVVRELEPLLDSAEMAPADWVRIGREIRDAYAAFDGFVVVHGTDTMAYTASALAFLFDGLTKTIILTGSQVPLCRPRTDALENLVTSLILAADYRIPEVGLYFGSRLFRGCRAVKVNCAGFDAFASPNLPALAETGTQIVVNYELVRQPAAEAPTSLTLQERLDPHVGVLWLFPGVTGAIVRNFLAPPLKGVVLQTFGVGNGPVNDPDFVAALSEAHERGVVLVDCTQCLSGAVAIDAYATGAGMARAGAVSGGDMTTEAALTKLMVLFGSGCASEEVRELVQRDLRGELSETAR
jgi:L-asparaginase